MSDPFLGEIRLFAGDYAPRGWAFCDGQLIAVAANDALFSLFGTYYGGDGRTTFGLPDFRGRVPVHQGQGPGLSSRGIGAKAGAETATVTVNEIPSHDHRGRLQAVNLAATSKDPIGNQFAIAAGNTYHSGEGRGATPTLMNAGAMASAGSGAPHPNVAQSLVLNFIVALSGIYPSRN